MQRTTEERETMHRWSFPLPQISPPRSISMSAAPLTSPHPQMIEMQAHVNFPNNQVNTKSRFHLVDPHFAEARRKMLLDSLSKEEAAKYEESKLFLPYDWMHPEIDAGIVKEFDQTTVSNIDPIAVGSFLMHPNSLSKAGMQTVPYASPFSDPYAMQNQLYHQYQSDEFMMYQFKTKPCEKKFDHDRLSCPYIHQGGYARRDPMKYGYLGELCQEFRGTGQCRFGENCRLAHGAFELWLHPTRYHTRMCDRGSVCWRTYCFLAHRPEEMRPEVYSDVPTYDDNRFGFGIMGGPTMFGGILPTFSMQSPHGSATPFAFNEGIDNAVKSESSGGKRQKMTESASFEVVLDAIKDLGIL